MKSITGKRVKELLSKNQAHAIDLGAEVDYKKNHIKGAVNIPYAEKEFVQEVEKRFSKKKEEIILCADSKLETHMSRLGRRLEDAGYKNVYQYKASPSEWEESHLDVVR